jgi:hypothetical protein
MKMSQVRLVAIATLKFSYKPDLTDYEKYDLTIVDIALGFCSVTNMAEKLFMKKMIFNLIALRGMKRE